jgi:hypothetical protein
VFARKNWLHIDRQTHVRSAAMVSATIPRLRNRRERTREMAIGRAPAPTQRRLIICTLTFRILVDDHDSEFNRVIATLEAVDLKPGRLLESPGVGAV